MYERRDLQGGYDSIKVCRRKNPEKSKLFIQQAENTEKNEKKIPPLRRSRSRCRAIQKLSSPYHNITFSCFQIYTLVSLGAFAINSELHTA